MSVSNKVYCNEDDCLASELHHQGIGYVLLENAFLQIADFERANPLAATLDVTLLHAKLDHLAQQYCPVVTQLNLVYSRSFMLVEYAAYLVFQRQPILLAIYPHLLEILIQAVKPVDITSFLGRKLHGRFQNEMGNGYNVHLECSCIKHRIGPVSIKMYDKFNILLHIETTLTNVSFFKQCRQVNHRDSTTTNKDACKAFVDHKELDPDIVVKLHWPKLDLVSQVEILSVSQQFPFRTERRK